MGKFSFSICEVSRQSFQTSKKLIQTYLLSYGAAATPAASGGRQTGLLWKCYKERTWMPQCAYCWFSDSELLSNTVHCRSGTAATSCHYRSIADGRYFCRTLVWSFIYSKQFFTLYLMSKVRQHQQQVEYLAYTWVSWMCSLCAQHLK